MHVVVFEIQFDLTHSAFLIMGFQGETSLAAPLKLLPSTDLRK